MLLDLLVIEAVLVVVTVVAEPLGQAGQCSDHVILRLHEWIVIVSIRHIGHVSEVPVRLKGITLSFAVVSKRGTLSHGMRSLLLGDACVSLLQGSQLINHSFIGVIVLSL